MKRGMLVSLLVGLVLLLSAQVAVGKGAPDKVGNPQARQSHAPVELVDGSTQQDEAPKADSGHAHGQSAKAKPIEKAQSASMKPKAKAKPAEKRAKPVAKGHEARGKSKKSGKPKNPIAAEVSKPHPASAAAKHPTPPAPPVASEEPATTVEPTTVYLHGAHVGADSTTFGRESDCGGLTDAVVWHFVLNGLDHGTEPAKLTVTFKNAGVRTAVGKPVGKGAVQHFYVGTPSHDVLLGGSAVVKSADTGKLVLSHVSVCGCDKPDEPDKPDNPDCPDKPDKPDCPDKPDHPDCPDQPDTPDKPSTPDQPVKPAVYQPDEPALPYTETESVDTVSDEPYLPYTGDPGAFILGAATLAAMTGKKLRIWARRMR